MSTERPSWGGLPAESVDHAVTHRLFLTNWLLSDVVLDDDSRAVDLAADAIPMGYTQLYVLEKRAVVGRGKVRRTWPARFSPEPDDAASGGPFWAVTRRGKHPGRTELAGDLDTALAEAVHASSLRPQDVLVVVRVLEEHFWH